MMFINWDWSYVENTLNKAVGKPETIPAKIKSEIPLPTLLSLISSPSHIKNTVPADTTTIVITICTADIFPKRLAPELPPTLCKNIINP